jgi:SagB-type dehydrogenase family enzyme
MTLAQTIITRRSAPSFSSKPISRERLATALYLGNGVKLRGELSAADSPQRNAPSAGNLGSVEVYPIVLEVESIERGIYHYDSRAHSLCRLHSGNFQSWLKTRVLSQRGYGTPAAALVLTCALGCLRAKYGSRGYRLALLDAGHVSENLYLAATALGLGVRAAAGFLESELDRALGLDGLRQASVLVVLLGAPGV